MPVMTASSRLTAAISTQRLRPRQSLLILVAFFDDKDDGKLGMLLRDAFDLYAKQIAPHPDYEVLPKTDPGQKTPPLLGSKRL
jgi:hypothetical protein